ncbi:MAG TPA: hypothetical protein PJ991_11495 [Kiritimatiellia bacterium]|nr:hypothetical protein [Kiritimatiellia bacterium]
MKRILIAVFTLASLLPAFAGRDALIDHRDKWNLFTKLELSFTEIDNSSALLGGVAIGGLLNDQLGVGIAAHTLLGNVDTESPFLKSIENTDLIYGGFYTEYVFTPESLFYVSLDLLIGGGQLRVQRIAGGEEKSNLFVVEPGLNVFVNITETFHFGLGASYRFVRNVDIPGLEDSDLSGLTGTIFFRFTQF